MIEGISIQYYPPHYHAAWGSEVSWQVGYPIGDAWVVHLAENERAMMEKIEAEIGSQQLDGFTLFMNPDKGWQMSTRRQGKPGWSITHIPNEQAQAVLSMLEASGHPDGPIQVTTVGEPATALAEAVAAATAARESLTALIRARVP